MISLGDALLKMGVDKSQFDKSMTEAKQNVKSSMAGIRTSMKVAGAAFTALGAAGLKFSADARKMNAQLGQTALTLGVTSAEMRELALETTNVTFKLQSVTDTFNLLSKAGIRNTEEMKKSATAFDTLGDAIGMSAEAVADLLLPAVKLFGEEIPTTAAELDKFTWMTKKTLVDLTDFGTLLTRMAPYMDDLKMSMDDAIITLAALGEQGIVGTAATLKLRTAITQAASSGEDLNTMLGISQEEIAGYKQQMAEAIGITQEYADMANTQYGIMDKLKQTWSELTFRLGSFLEPLEPLMALMTPLGIAMIFFSTNMGIATAKTVAHTIALIAHKVVVAATTLAHWGLNAVTLKGIAITQAATAAKIALALAIHGVGAAIKIALGPIGWAIAALTVLGLLIYGIVQKTGEAERALKKMADSIVADFERIKTEGSDALRAIATEYDIQIGKAKQVGDTEGAMRLEFERTSEQIKLQRQIIANLQARYAGMVAVVGENVTAAKNLKASLDQEKLALVGLEGSLKTTIESYQALADARQEILTEYKELIERYYGEGGLFAEAEKEYLDAVAAANKRHDEELQREAESLTNAYKQQFETRKQSLYDWAGLFDQIPKWAHASGQELLRNLQQQVRWFDIWQDEVATLAKRGVEEGLLDELRAMGPAALPQIMALRQMSDEQLTKYQELWQKKTEQVTAQTTDELGQLVINADTQLAGLVGLAKGADSPVQEFINAYNERLRELADGNAAVLDVLKQDYNTKLGEIGIALADEMGKWVAIAEEAGLDIPQGLLDGLASGRPGLEAELTNYTNAITTWVDKNVADIARLEAALKRISEIPITAPTVTPVPGAPAEPPWWQAPSLVEWLLGQHGAVVTRPTAAIIGESPLTTPEIVSPVALMKETFEDVLTRFKTREGKVIEIQSEITSPESIEMPQFEPIEIQSRILAPLLPELPIFKPLELHIKATVEGLVEGLDKITDPLRLAFGDLLSNLPPLRLEEMRVATLPTGQQQITKNYYFNTTFPNLTIREEVDITKISRAQAREIRSGLIAKGLI